MLVEPNKSLKDYNTFGIDCKAKYYVSVTTTAELIEILSDQKYKDRFILGGGSNMLLTQDINALVIHLNLKGITVLSETKEQVQIEALAGENWHQFVLSCIERGYGGLENLSLIPGNVGTTPIQNIGAYGVELKDTFESCKAIEIETKTVVKFSRETCNFGYRTSIFKNEARDKYIITSVVFNLTKIHHKKSISYGAIKQQLSEKHIKEPTIKNISDAVISIRESKLPDPKKLGNSGSFFKNPVIDTEAFRHFRVKFPEAPFYEVSPTEFKVPAGWLIEQAGFKGKQFGDAGVHKNQALVLVNYGNATGSEIWELAVRIQNKVKEKFGIYIEPEVNVF
jgi:UDP-N-acetylmuramate dehydrogenase